MKRARAPRNKAPGFTTRRWTPDEDELFTLAINEDKKNSETLSVEFDRTVAAVRSRANILGLKRQLMENDNRGIALATSKEIRTA